MEDKDFEMVLCKQFIVAINAVLNARNLSAPLILVITYHVVWARVGISWCSSG
jgi:hypothetical protein